MTHAVVEKLLARAERDYLIGGETGFRYRIRRSVNVRADYSLLEEALRVHPVFEIVAYAPVREGRARISRASEVQVDCDVLLRYRPELAELRRRFDEARSASNKFEIENFLHENFNEARKKANVLPECVRIFEYMIENSAEIKGRYIRQLPHGQSTKLIGAESLLLRMFKHHCGLAERISWAEFYREFGLERKPPTFQFFATEAICDGYSLRDFHGVLTPENLSRFKFSSDQIVLIVENEECFYALQGRAPAVCVIPGGGMQVASAGFLDAILPPRRYYWGDIDKEGLEIYGHASRVLPGLCPLFMDADILQRYRSLARKRGPQKTGRPPGGIEAFYHEVCAEGWRLEQEQIPLDDVLAAIEEMRSGGR
jgi:hypothetical protein